MASLSLVVRLVQGDKDSALSRDQAGFTGHLLVGSISHRKARRWRSGLALDQALPEDSLEELPVGSLTRAESRVLALAAAGHSTSEIAVHLCVSRQAVAYHVGNLLRKFQASNRPGLVARAYVCGVLASDRWPPEAGSCHLTDGGSAVARERRWY
jgi:DNA-binding CsgD family transcriptional regulator